MQNTCTKFDSFAYMTISGKRPNHDTRFGLDAGKLILTLSKTIQMFENNDKTIFTNVDFFCFISDNFLRMKFERHLASFMEAGLDMVQKSYSFENKMKPYLLQSYLDARQTAPFLDFYDVSNRSLMLHVSYWVQNRRFSFYLKEKCDLNTFKKPEAPVSLADLYAVCVVFIVLILSSSLSFVVEVSCFLKYFE